MIPCVVMETPEEGLGGSGWQHPGAFRQLPPNARFKKELTVITEHQFGERVGIFRVLDLLQAEKIKTSFFVNGSTVEAYPDLMKEIVSRGHELASENWRHEFGMLQTKEEEQADIERTVAMFEKVLGFKPKGYISAGERPSGDTPGILVQNGYVYWNAFLHEELPYVLQVDAGELVILSYGVWLTDRRASKDTGYTHREMLQTWKDNFDYLYEEGKRYPSMMLLGLHPFLIGRPFRAQMLREFIRYAKRHEGVWFARCMDVANYWKENFHDHQVERWPNYGTGLPLPEPGGVT
ncbi:MAG: polysaccharide deacetylase family protein [Deltaproteobacteria bacterium]|nr:polysaccharide deacetylase family protein [Deltaproteobacteria bacterium]